MTREQYRRAYRLVRLLSGGNEKRVVCHILNSPEFRDITPAMDTVVRQHLISRLGGFNGWQNSARWATWVSIHWDND